MSDEPMTKQPTITEIRQWWADHPEETAWTTCSSRCIISRVMGEEYRVYPSAKKGGVVTKVGDHSFNETLTPTLNDLALAFDALEGEDRSESVIFSAKIITIFIDDWLTGDSHPLYCKTEGGKILRVRDDTQGGEK